MCKLAEHLVRVPSADHRGICACIELASFRQHCLHNECRELDEIESRYIQGRSVRNRYINGHVLHSLIGVSIHCGNLRLKDQFPCRYCAGVIKGNPAPE